VGAEVIEGFHNCLCGCRFSGPVAVDELLAVNEALEKLAKEDEQKAELVKLRYFGGLSFEEAAEVLRVSVPTSKRWWAYSRAWLFEEIGRKGTLNRS